MTKLAKFIEDYISDHGISRRALAEKMDVQHQTLNHYLNTDSDPTLYFLTRLSGATGYDLLTLVAQVAPDYIHQASADVMLLAQRIDKLPEPQRGIIIDLIRGALKSSENVNNASEVSKGNKGKRKS